MISCRWVASAVTAALLFSTPTLTQQTVNQSPTTNTAIFTASDNSLQFALNIPTNSATNDDLYFSLSGPTTSWLAVGLGSNVMKNAFIIMAYAGKETENITISPRLSTSGHSEPSYYPNATIEWLPGSGLVNGTMTANGRCRNCRVWPGGALQVNSSSENMIFASGPAGMTIGSDSLAASVKAHSSYGVFEMDLRRASGVGGVPVLTNSSSTSTSVGAEQVEMNEYYNAAGPVHACIMVFVFFGFMPLNVLVLRVLGSVKFHALGQTIATVMAIIGAGVGIYIGTMFNRSKHWNSPHQIFGLLIVLGVIAQFVLGYFHHLIYKKSQQTTKLAPVHIWLGRVVIPFGVVNAFIGFPFALSPSYDWILGVLLVVIGIPTALILWFKACWTKRNAAKKTGGGAVPDGPPFFDPSNPAGGAASAPDAQYRGYMGNDEGGIHLTRFDTQQYQQQQYRQQQQQQQQYGYKGTSNLYHQQPVEPYSRV